MLLAFRKMTVKSMKPEEAAYAPSLCFLNMRFLEPDCAKLTARHTGATVGRTELVPAEMDVIACQGNSNRAMVDDLWVRLLPWIRVGPQGMHHTSKPGPQPFIWTPWARRLWELHLSDLEIEKYCMWRHAHREQSTTLSPSVLIFLKLNRELSAPRNVKLSF